jgi:hypothetical protein
MRTLNTILLLAAVGGFALPASAASLEGKITGYECGDNCYLTVMDASGEEHTGLCTATLCESWNAETAMPDSFKGTQVKIKVGTGTQVDGSGNNMGDMESFDEIELLGADSATHCADDELTVFSCELKNKKTVSVCASDDVSSHSGYLQYRFGKIGKVELSVPAKKKSFPQELSLQHSKDDSAEYNYMSFSNGGNFTYELTSFRQFKATNSEGNQTPESSDTLTVRDIRKSMREGDIVFSNECKTLGAPLDADVVSEWTGVKWEKAGF